MDNYYELIDSKFVPQPTKKDLIRIESLKIPPNWKNVKVSKDSKSKVQVVGRDSKNREQRIYHPEWIKHTTELKYKTMNKLSQKYKQFDEFLDKLIRRKDLSFECVVANIIKLLMLLNIRVGNEIYFEENGTCGITTLRKTNLKIVDSEYFLNFIGKKGVEHSKHIKSIKVKNFIDKMRKTKHERLFCYEKEQEIIPITSSEINQFIKEHLGENFTTKDLRTYSANQIFKQQLFSFGNPKNEKDALIKIREAIKFTAIQLGNTPKVCKDSYIDPVLINKYHKRGLTTHK
jgi:DNA topoisomerase-1